MENITAAAVSVKNRIHQKDKSILNMEKWIERSKNKNTDLILFPELNVSGYILNPVVSEIAETILGTIYEITPKFYKSLTDV